MIEKWKDLGIKDKVLYVMAVVLLLSGIVLAFLSFGIIHTIATGSLIYIALAFITGAGIFGVSIYFKTKLGEFKSDTTDIIEKAIERVIDKR